MDLDVSSENPTKAPDTDIMELGMDMDMPLFLMSKFCDTALRQLSHSNQITGQDEIPVAPGPSLFPDVFLDSRISNITYRPKRRGKAHSSTSLNSSQSNNSYTHSTITANDTLNCSDLVEPESQMLSIQRLPNPSNHIKSFSLSEFMNHNSCSESKDEDLVLEHKVHGLTSHAKERLESYRPILQNRVESGKWSGVRTSQLGDNLMDSDEVSVFYGILDKPCSIKSKRLGKLFNQIGVASLPLQSMTSVRKCLFLHDGTGRIELIDLTGELKFDEVISGIVIAVAGKIKENCLQVEDVIFATPCSPQWPLPRENNIEMVFVSGLLTRRPKPEAILLLNLLQDYLLGLSGSAYEQKEVISKRCRLFLVGSFPSSKSRSESIDDVVEESKESLDRLDEFLNPLLETMEVFIVPGDNEPTFTSSFPQPPIHKNLLPESGKYKSLKRLTNPARIQVSISQSSPRDDNPITDSQGSNYSLLNSSMADFLREDISFTDVLLQSGRNLKESMDYCDISCPMEMGLKLLKWGHLHPTNCDNSLAEDIFRLHGSLPNLCVIGNTSEFKYVNYNNAKVVGVPSFYKSHTVVVLTRELDVVPLSFKMA